jgi:hypothetical protein
LARGFFSSLPKLIIVYSVHFFSLHHTAEM